MSEKEYVIREAYNSMPDYQCRISKTEFHRRIDLAFRAAFCTLTEKFDYDKAVEIIVHGEGEKEEEKPLNDPMKYPYHLDPQPSPTPTRAEWEAWATEMAIAIHDDGGWSRIFNALRSMPIVPKE